MNLTVVFLTVVALGLLIGPTAAIIAFTLVEVADIIRAGLKAR